MEAAQLSEENVQPVSQTEIKKAAGSAALIKWQRRWDLTEKGRGLYDLQKKVTTKSLDFSGLGNQRLLLQLQSGHCHLREHLYRVGLSETPWCDCGAPETVNSSPFRVNSHSIGTIVLHY